MESNLAESRRNGWTADRRRLFLETLAAGIDVRRACGRVGLSRQAAYKLRRRDAGFARAWDASLQVARRAARESWLAALPDRLRRAMERSEVLPQDTVKSVRPV